MFIGHHAVAFGSKKIAPRTSLGTALMAANWLDLIWPIFLILGIEHVRLSGATNPFLAADFYDYPWTHSLLMSIVWSLAFAAVYWMITKYARGAVISGLLVFSHWVLDFVTHIPDLPLAPGSSTKVGLQMWKSPLATIVVESILFFIGTVVYLRATRARDRTGYFAFAGLVVFVVAIYVASIVGPPPPKADAIGYAGLAAWLFPVWGYWIDRHREPVP